MFGGWVTTLAGLGHSLWIFGFLQLFSNIGYYVLSILGEPVAGALYAATGFELLTSGMGTGAFSVLLLRLTEKRFSATQYALFSSLFALPRVAAGPITGFAVAAIGWSSFFLTTLVIGIPGLMMLNRFAPFGVREPQFEHEDEPAVSRASVGSSATRVSRQRSVWQSARRCCWLCSTRWTRCARHQALDSISPQRCGDSPTPLTPVAGSRSSAFSPSRSSEACSSQPRASAGHARHPESVFVGEQPGGAEDIGTPWNEWRRRLNRRLR